MLQLNEIKRENDVDEVEQKPPIEHPTINKQPQPQSRKMTKHVMGIKKKSGHPTKKDALMLMQATDERPPTIVRTADNVEWTFLESFPDYDKMLKFVRENQCQSRVFDEKMSRIKYVCSRKYSNNCKLALLAFKDQKRGYHVYKHGEHEHMDTDNNNSRPIITGGNVLMPPANPPRILRTPDSIEWQFLQTFSNNDKVCKFRRANLCKSITWDEKWWKIRYYCKHKSSRNCPFMLLPIKTTAQGYHVYKHGEHRHYNHPVQIFDGNQYMDQVELIQVKEEVIEEEEISLGEEQLQEEEVIEQEEDMMIKYEQDDGGAAIEEHGNGPRREDQSDQQDEEENLASFSGMGEIKQEPSENDDTRDSFLNWPMTAAEPEESTSTSISTNKNNYGNEFQMLKWQIKNVEAKNRRLKEEHHKEMAELKAKPQVETIGEKLIKEMGGKSKMTKIRNKEKISFSYPAKDG